MRAPRTAHSPLGMILACAFLSLVTAQGMRWSSMESTRHTLTFGHTDSTGDALPSRRISRAREYAIRAVCQAVGGASSSQRAGAWVAPSGDLVHEMCTEVVGISRGDNLNDVAGAMQLIARTIGMMLAQNCVMVTAESVNCEFVKPM